MKIGKKGLCGILAGLAVAGVIGTVGAVRYNNSQKKELSIVESTSFLDLENWKDNGIKSEDIEKAYEIIKPIKEKNTNEEYKYLDFLMDFYEYTIKNRKFKEPYVNRVDRFFSDIHSNNAQVKRDEINEFLEFSKKNIYSN